MEKVFRKNRKEMANALEIENVSFYYNEGTGFALEDIDLEIEDRDFVGIVGANGSGKSTLLKLILGVLKPEKGEITFWGEKMSKVRDKIGYVSQYEDVDFDFPMTVTEIVLSGKMRGRYVNKYSDKDKMEAQKHMEELDIWEYRDENLKNLSGGQKQRVFLARALINNPSILILDEPLVNIDIKTQRDFYEILRKLNEYMTILIVDHNLSSLVDYVDKVVCIDKCKEHTIEVHTKNLESLIEK
ncbi:ATP-binding cassette domain-containing protein [Candidatus Dojkabacteria bacterium]|nr:ATP-binding cassette domain-containing protein [Candidatus Dojkabacteria bacterium]